jgi:FMN phosphatase YigB (HAD superfamily)
MLKDIELIIFDWGGTLHESKTDSIFDGVPEVLDKLSERYPLVLISLAKSQDPKTRRQKIGDSGISQYFKSILVGGEDKDEMYESILSDLNVNPENVLIVDDRAIRGIAWGNRKGAKTIWIQQGKFANELPDNETGTPTFVISDIKDLNNIFK